ncbi:MAG: hypothetical protein QXY61_04815 [Candidatus Anstonellales archaeon]
MIADSIESWGAYGGWRFGYVFELEGKREENVAYALAKIADEIEGKAYIHCGLDTKFIDEKIKDAKGNGIGELVGFFEKFKAGDVFEKACGEKKELRPAAESYFFNKILNAFNVPYRLTAKMLDEYRIDAKPKEPDDQIVFIGKYKEWVAIKKLTIPGSEEYEIGGILANICTTIVPKAFQFARVSSNIKTSRGKSMKILIGMLKEAGGGDEKQTAANVNAVFEAYGILPYPTLAMLEKAYPDLKVKKPKGRIPKG